eukprot:m.136477 g.136477  ORF g.136477 m.136477 type:complete len:103 (+) comp13945_c0_seq3:156-464(+)
MREIVCAALVVLGLGSGVAAAGCFVKPCFPQSDIQVIRNISYGSAYDSVTKQTISLTLDGQVNASSSSSPIPSPHRLEDLSVFFLADKAAPCPNGTFSVDFL